MDLRIECLCVDARDPESVASFWEAALGWRRTSEDPDEVVLEPPAGSAEEGVVPDLLFLRVPEVKTLKNRLDLDLRPVTSKRRLSVSNRSAQCASSSARPPRRRGSF